MLFAPGETLQAPHVLDLPLTRYPHGTYRECGAKLEIVAYLHDTVAIKRILDNVKGTQRGKGDTGLQKSAV